MEPIDNPPVDKSNPEYGLHGYTLHIVLHNTAAEIDLVWILSSALR